MAEFTGVGLGVQTPDIAGKLSQLLSIQGQKQALAGQAAEVAGAQQTQRQRQALAEFDYSQLYGPDGNISLEKIPLIREAAGDLYPDVAPKLIDARQRQLEAQKTLFSLDSQKRDELAGMMGPLIGMDDEKLQGQEGLQAINKTLEEFGTLHGDAALPVIAAYGPALKAARPDRRRDEIRRIQMQAQNASQQIASQQPSYLSTGPTAQQVNPTASGDAQKSIGMGLPPGVYQDSNGAQFQLVNGKLTPLGSPTGRGGGKPSGSPSAPAEEPRKFMQPVPGQKDLEEHVTQTRKADSDYGQNRHVNEEILRLSADTSTGPGSALWHTGALGKITGTFGGNAGADYQKIGAYLDRQAAMAGQQMGLPETNAGLQTAANLSGTTDYTPEALQTKVKLTDAMVEGAHQYRQGLDKVIGTGPNQDLSNLNAFRGQWADNFDPNVFRAENAIRRGDKAELAAIKDEVGSRGMAELKRKSENLRKLEAGELLK